MSHEAGHVESADGYDAPPLPSATQTVTSSRYIGGYPGDTRIPGPPQWDSWRPGEWSRGVPTRQDTPTLDELRTNGGGGYLAGDEWMMANESPDTILRLQREMFQAGLLDGDADIIPGYFDDATRAAFEGLLDRSNGMRTDWLSALETLRNNPIPADKKDEPKVTPFVAQVSNPEDIKMSLRDTFRSALGTGAIKPEDLQSLVAEFQGNQISSQKSQYDAYQGAGGTVTAPPSLEAFADTKAKKTDPVAYDAYKALDAFSTILNTMGGSGAVGS